MTLVSGSNLGPYRIVSPLGAGGMGEVYKALDTRLDRTVAIKVLPAASSEDEKARARFQREAKLVSQFNHPNICALYDVGSSNGTTYIVMELIDGESLASRLGRGPIPLRDVFPCAIQVADALDRAHRAGVIHRDLKPANVMLTRGGAKLLDFGLARAITPVASNDDPTMAKPLTTPGTFVGTLPYMAPEQLHGGETDERTDIFAFGALLYEMITGRRAFDARSSASLVVQILEHEPPAPSSIQPIISVALERVLMTCLEKDPNCRFQCAGDLARELRRIEAGGAGEPETATTTAPLPSRKVLYGLVAAAVVAIAAALGGFLAGREATDPPRRATFTQLTFDTGEELQPAISPDGRTFAYVKRVVGQRDIFLQRVGGSSAINLTEGNAVADEGPAFSPDGNLIAFRSNRDGGGIFVMGATGESVRRLTESGFDPAWSPDGTRVVYSTERTGTPRTVYGGGELWTVELANGRSKRLFQGPALQPSWSPDGRRIAFWASHSGGHRDIFVIDATGKPGSLVNVTADAHLDWNPVWAPDGNSLYFSSERNGTMNLWRVAVDQSSGKPIGAVEPLDAASPDASSISISGDGTRILYRSTSYYGSIERIRFDSTTETVEADGVVFDGSLPIRNAAASPDGSLIAFSTSGVQEDVYVMAADGTGVRQLTTDAARDRGLSWWPDGSRIVFYSNRGGAWQGWTIRPDGSRLEQLTEMDANWPRISPDGTRVTFQSSMQSIVAELATLPVTEGKPLPQVGGSSFLPETWSPDGTKLAGTPWGGPGAYIYSFADDRLRLVSPTARMTAFIDDRRLLLVERDGRIRIADVATLEVRDIARMTTSDDTDALDSIAISADADTILLIRTRADSDIWQMTR